MGGRPLGISAVLSRMDYWLGCCLPKDENEMDSTSFCKKIINHSYFIFLIFLKGEASKDKISKSFWEAIGKLRQYGHLIEGKDQKYASQSFYCFIFTHYLYAAGEHLLRQTAEIWIWAVEPLYIWGIHGLSGVQGSLVGMPATSKAIYWFWFNHVIQG